MNVVLALLLLFSVDGVISSRRPNIIHIMADDLGWDNLAFRNGGRTKTPYIDSLFSQGIALDRYYTFKICGPSRASVMTGRMPFNVGFYGDGDDQHIANYTSIAQVLKDHGGYETHCIGKWDVGYVVKETTPTYKGFDSFFGYYKACNDDLFYHSTNTCDDEDAQNVPIDLSRNTGSKFEAARGYRGQYSTRLFKDEALRHIRRHAQTNDSTPLYLYVAPQNVHLACGTKDSKLKQGIQAPCETVRLFDRVKNDTFKAQSAVTTELDYLVGNITETLKSYDDLWENTLIVFTSDNGGPLDHTTNYPLRGGKHTFFEGGVRVIACVAGGYVPLSSQGTIYRGLSHSSDWFRTLAEGVANVSFSTFPSDSNNQWNAMLSNNTSDSPRHVIVHQVENEYFSENVAAIMMDEMKLIVGNPGDARTLQWPVLSEKSVSFGRTGGLFRDNETSCLAGIVADGVKDKSFDCTPGCLFNLTADPGEINNIYDDHPDLVSTMRLKLQIAAENAIPPSAYWNNATRPLRKICKQQDQTGFLEPLGVLV